ncbi:MAG: hypothetical protein Q7J98_14080 [Kiritimatiellia bacterium]|nr:hypothetical protein [Kiritimatiellia bacterium]
MTRFKEIIAGIKSCFSLTANERLIIMLVLALFLFGLALRWRHLNREHADSLPASGGATGDQGYEPADREMNTLQI